jgi:L-rhamnose mutarotase
MKRFCKVVGLKADKIDAYNALHAAVWPGVEAMITACNMHNFSIFLRQFPDGNHYLVMYFEYVGTDYAADMKQMAADPTTQEWWKLTDPLQEPFPDRAAGDWWADLDEAYHLD